MGLDSKITGTMVYAGNFVLPFILGAGHPVAAVAYGAAWGKENFDKPFEGGAKFAVDAARGLGALWFAYSTVTDLLIFRPIQEEKSGAMAYKLARDFFK